MMLFTYPTILFPARLAPSLLEVLRPALKARRTHGEPVDPELWSFLELCSTAASASAAAFLGSSVSPDSSTSYGRTTKIVAEELGLTERRVRQLCVSGKLDARKRKGHWDIAA